ncbi:MAG: 2-phospho-L-lactate transferase [Candidatus Bathyarchaeia archaeon]
MGDLTKLKVTALAGGVGAARFLRGLIEVVPQQNVSIIGNVGDDLTLYGLHISPDLDIVMYTLADLVCKEKGWGIEGDTFNCLNMLSKYGFDSWFKLGDADLATHIYRTYMIKSGLTLSQVTLELCRRLGLKVRLIPVTDDHLRTVVISDEGRLSFQEYFVKRRCEPKVLSVVFEGVENAEPAPGVFEALEDADVIVVCPSNPILSIGPILAVKGVRDFLRKSLKPIVAVSPIVAGKALKGPADKILLELGLKPSALTVAELYRDFLKVFIVDVRDESLKFEVEHLGIKVFLTDTVMSDLSKQVALARETLKAALEIHM